MKAFEISRKMAVFFLFLIIALQLAYFTFVFGWQREGYHSDESWSYNFANAYYQQSICFDNDGRRANYDAWTDSQTLRDFISVQSGQEFSYSSTLFNCSRDNAPPFVHAVLLHTISSFFPDTFSWWYAYAINVVFYIAAVISLYLLSSELLHSRFVSLLTCCFYGCVSASLNDFIYLRTYAILTALTLLCTYIHCRIFRKKFQKIYPELCGIFLINIIGGMSHYYFLAYSFCLTLFFGLYQLFTKRWKPAIIYGITQLLSVVVCFILYPYGLQIIKNGVTRSIIQMPLLWEIKYCIQLVFGEATGFFVQFPTPVTWAYLHIILVFLAIFASGFSFIFRKEPWFKNGIKTGVAKGKAMLKKLPARIKNMNKLPFLIALSASLMLVIIAKVCDIYRMGIYSDRYLFMLMPVALMLCITFLFWLIKKIFRRRKKLRPYVLVLFLLLGVLSNHILFPCVYLFERSSDAPYLPELTEDASVIVITNDDWKLVCYSTLLRNSNCFYAVNTADCIEDTTLQSLEALDDKNSPVYLVLETDRLRREDAPRYSEDEDAGFIPLEDALNFDCSLNDILSSYSTISWTTMSKLVQTEDSFQGHLSVYRLR